MDERKLSAEELDTIGEIMNISMGAAATAVSTMLERQVVITTPKIEQNSMKNIDCRELEPAIVVKINYIEGLSGTNVVVLRRNDMRIILDLLMGNDLADRDDDFEFDEMSMSAACEVMNQMMGASSTALSELLSHTINISTPQALLVESEKEFHELLKEFDSDDEVTSISFKMTIKETLDTSFSSFMPIELARSIVLSLHNEMAEEPAPPPQAAPPEQPVAAPKPTQPAATSQPTQSAPTPRQEESRAPRPENVQHPSPPVPPQEQVRQPQPPQQPQVQSYAPQPAAPMYAQPQYQPQPPDQYQYAMQQPNASVPYRQQYPQYPQQPYSGEYYQQPYGQYPEPQTNMRFSAPAVRQADFPEFSVNGKPVGAPYSSNINLLMGVQLEVSVIVGRSKQKIRDVLDFGQGSVIELDKQTGAPAEIMVNGQLLAYGDVVVVGDNFGVRITEIVGTKELLDSLDVKK